MGAPVAVPFLIACLGGDRQGQGWQMSIAWGPEQAKGTQGDEHSDIYAAGIIP